jgi:hypothetical protein
MHILRHFFFLVVGFIVLFAFITAMAGLVYLVIHFQELMAYIIATLAAIIISYIVGRLLLNEVI